MDDTTDLSRLNQNLKKLELDPNSKGPYAILIATGAYCPVHKMHLEILEEAKEHLVGFGYTTLAGFISPSHDSYVKRKMEGDGSFFIPSVHRLKLCSILLSDSTWITETSWEATQPRFQYINETVSSAYPNLKFTLFYVAGMDLALKSQLVDGIGFSGGFAPVVAVGRPDYALPGRWQPSSSFFVVAKEMEDMSSTKVRNALLTKNSALVKEMCGDKVEEYIISNQLVPNQ